MYFFFFLFIRNFVYKLPLAQLMPYKISIRWVKSVRVWWKKNNKPTGRQKCSWMNFQTSEITTVNILYTMLTTIAVESIHIISVIEYSILKNWEAKTPEIGRHDLNCDCLTVTLALSYSLVVFVCLFRVKKNYWPISSNYR